MYMVLIIKNKRRKPLRKKNNKKTGQPSVSLTIKKYVNTAIHKMAENKCVQIQGSRSFGTILQSPDLGVYPLAPLSTFWTIGQGVGQGQRIGNQLKTRRVMLNYVLRPNFYNATSNDQPLPQEVNMFLGYVKNTPSQLPIASDFSFLYQNGNTTSAPSGTVRDLISVINTDYWVIKKRWTHKIGYASNTGSGSIPQAAYLANNDFKMNVVKRMDITKYLPRTISFQDTAITSLQKNLFFFQQSIMATGNLGSAIQQPTNIDFWIDYQYEDL